MSIIPLTCITISGVSSFFLFDVFIYTISRVEKHTLFPQILLFWHPFQCAVVQSLLKKTTTTKPFLLVFLYKHHTHLWIQVAPLGPSDKWPPKFLDLKTPIRPKKKIIVWLSSTTFLGVGAGRWIFFFFLRFFSKSKSKLYRIIASISPKKVQISLLYQKIPLYKF